MSRRAPLLALLLVLAAGLPLASGHRRLAQARAEEARALAAFDAALAAWEAEVPPLDDPGLREAVEALRRAEGAARLPAAERVAMASALAGRGLPPDPAREAGHHALLAGLPALRAAQDEAAAARLAREQAAASPLMWPLRAAGLISGP